MSGSKEAQQKIELERVETPIGLTPSEEDEARSFGEVRERHQNVQFWIIFGLAAIICIGLYNAFYKWLDGLDSKVNNTNWHIGLMLIIPATTILLSLIAALRYKRSSPEKEDLTPHQIQQIYQIFRFFKDGSGSAP